MDDIISPKKRLGAIAGLVILVIIGGHILFGKGRPIAPFIKKITPNSYESH